MKLAFLRKVKPLYCFLLILFLFAFLYDYHEIISMKPIGIHQWRSSVSAAFPVNLAEGGSFLRTQTNALLADNYSSDITVVEFPLIYWLISLLYKLFGVNELWFRMVQVIIGFIGLVYLFRASYIITRDWVFAGMIPIIIFTSPIYVFYLNGFIPDSVALSLTFGGLFYFLKFSENRRTKTWMASMLFFLLAGLTKTSSLLPFFGIGGVALLDLVQKVRKREGSGMFIFGWKHILAYASVLLLIIAWYLYAKFYSEGHAGSVSAVEIRPIWNLDHERVMESWVAMKQRFHDKDFHNPWFLLFSMVIFLGMIPFYRQSLRFLYILNILVVAGALTFTLLFFRSMRDHDYYQINNLIILVSIWLGFFALAKKTWPRIYGSPWTKVAVALVVVGLWYSCDRNMRWRYHKDNWHLYHSQVNIHRFDIDPWLEELGIDHNAKVHCTPDPSVNISLYLCKRKGLTDFMPPFNLSLEEKVDILHQAGIEYVIVGGREDYKKPKYLDLILGERLGQRGDTEIFRLKDRY